MTTIEVDFEGNESDLVGSFNKVGSASKSMTDQVEESGDKMRTSGEGFDNLTERADTAETRFTGFYDTIGGTKDALAALSDESLSTSDKLIALGQAGADLAGGLVGFVIPMFQSLWTKLIATSAAQAVLNGVQAAGTAITGGLSTAMGVLNAVIRANPVLFLVGLISVLVGAFILLWNKSAGFRNFFIGMWNGIKNAVGGVVNWIKSIWNGLPGFFQGIANTIGRIFSGIGNAIKNAFKAAINFVVDILNGGISGINFLIRGYNAIPFAPDIPQIPKIPRMHSGGTVPGMPGTEQLIIAQAGEHVSKSGQGGGVALRVLPGGDKGVAELINWLIRKKYIRVVTA